MKPLVFTVLSAFLLIFPLFPAAISEAWVAPNPVDAEGKTCTLIINCNGITGASDKLFLQIVDRQNQKVWERTLEAPVNGLNKVHWGLTNDRGKRVVRGVYYARAWLAADTTTVQTFKIAVR